jgi:hypothetical protein
LVLPPYLPFEGKKPELLQQYLPLFDRAPFNDEEMDVYESYEGLAIKV